MAPLSTLLEVVNTLRSFGNRCFRRGNFDSAKDRYKQVGISFSPSLLTDFVITCGKMSVHLQVNHIVSHQFLGCDVAWEQGNPERP